MDQFKHYLGVKVAVSEEEKELDFPALGLKQKFTTCTLDENDPTILAIQKTWGPKVRVFVPGQMGTCDWWTDRLNVHVEKNDAGDYVITSFNVG